MTFMPLDWHTPTHLLGSYALAKLIMRLSTTRWVDMGEIKSSIHIRHWLSAPMLAFIAGVGWELLDHQYRGWWIFDPRGGDWADIAADLIGCLLALII